MAEITLKVVPPPRVMSPAIVPINAKCPPWCQANDFRKNPIRYSVAGGGAIGNNTGYNQNTTEKGLYSPDDAKVIGDFTGLTPPFDDDRDADDR